LGSRCGLKHYLIRKRAITDPNALKYPKIYLPLRKNPPNSFFKTLYYVISLHFTLQKPLLTAKKPLNALTSPEKRTLHHTK